MSDLSVLDIHFILKEFGQDLEKISDEDVENDLYPLGPTCPFSDAPSLSKLDMIKEFLKDGDNDSVARFVQSVNDQLSDPELNSLGPDLYYTRHYYNEQCTTYKVYRQILDRMVLRLQNCSELKSKCHALQQQNKKLSKQIEHLTSLKKYAKLQEQLQNVNSFFKKITSIIGRILRVGKLLN